MSFSGILNTSQKKQTGGGAGTVTGADNGLHVDGTDAFLGGELLENTEVEVGVFTFSLSVGTPALQTVSAAQQGPDILEGINFPLALNAAERVLIARQGESVAGLPDFNFIHGNTNNDTRGIFENAGRLALAVQGTGGNPLYIGGGTGNDLVFSNSAFSEIGRGVYNGGFQAPDNTGFWGPISDVMKNGTTFFGDTTMLNGGLSTNGSGIGFGMADNPACYGFWAFEDFQLTMNGPLKFQIGAVNGHPIFFDKVFAGPVALDAAKYLWVSVDGVDYKILLAV